MRYTFSLAAAWCAVLLPACTHEASMKVESPSGSAQQGSAVVLEPARPEEQFQLAMRYESGDGVRGDDAWAEYWAWRAALQGHEPARTWLRRRAHAERVDGGFIIVDALNHRRRKAHPSAQLWLVLAGPDQERVGEMPGEARTMMSETLPAIRERALRADVWAKYLLGAVYDFALADDAEALRWYTEAAEHGNVLAEDSLGHMYADGRGAPADSAQAARWFRAAADQGYARSQAMLGWLYESGKGVPEDPAEALRWYMQAARQGMPAAQVRVGSLYAAGKGVTKDDGEALRWFRSAAEAGSTEAATKIRVLEAKSRAK
jgi:TPR repeat protein